MRIHPLIKVSFLALTVFTSAVFADGVAGPEKCVVNGDKFSEHKHAPIQVTHQGSSITVCCEGCVRKFNKDPEKYIKLYNEALKTKSGVAPVAK